MNPLLSAAAFAASVAAGFYWRGFTRREAERDAAAFVADGSADTLHEAFHFWRGVRRIGWGCLLAGGAAGPLLGIGVRQWGLLALANALLFGAWFLFDFNPRLSRLRGLDPDYLSADPHAAYFPDRLLTRLGIGLRPVLRAVLAVAGAAYVAAGAVLVWWG
jgi:hypothetical protein